MDEPTPSPPVATGRLGPYRLLELLGSGAMGAVWLAEDDEEARRVALKLFHPGILDHDGFLARFAREAEAGSRVEHPNVVRTHGAEILRVDGVRRCFLVMEYVEGKTLRALLEEMRQVPEALVREIGRQVAAGLAAIHAAGIVHRDVKPENVLITPNSDVRVMDLGVSKLLDATRVLTQEGHFAGSLAYAAPEQIQGREVSYAADLYALGVLLQELVTGRNPFDRESSGAVVRAHLLDEPPDLLDEAPDATPFLGEVVRTLLAKDPARRLGSAAELEHTLSQGEASEWWKAHEDDAIRRRARIPRVPVRRETELHGRDDDLALLRTAWTRARDGKGNTVLLVGEAGIGKSRLVDAFLSEVRTADAHVLYGSWPPLGGMGAIADAVVAKLGAEDLDGKIRAYLPDSPLLAPPLAALLRHEPAPPGSVSLQGDALHAALVRLMQGLGAEKPVVWVIEDLHFADADARRIVLSLARAVEGRPVLLVLTSRPGLPEADATHFDRLENLRKTSLARLGAREVVLLLKDAFRSTHLAEKLGGKVALASDGNPFFVFETIRALKQGQLITQLPDGTWVDTKVIDTIPVPPAVRDLVEARLGDLSQAQREILDIGAVQGFEFDADLVAAVLERKRFEVLRDLAQIERTSGVVRSAGRRFRFDHHQIQEIVYADLSVPLREECHAALADAIERREGAADRDPATLDGDVAVELATHRLRGAQGPQCVPYLDAAFKHLLREHRVSAAIEISERVLRTPELVRGHARASLLLRQAEWLEFAGRISEQRRAIDEAVALADEDEDLTLRARSHRTRGHFLERALESEASVRELQLSLEVARVAGARNVEAAALNCLAMVELNVGRLAESERFLEAAIELHREIGDRRGEALAVGNLGQVRYAQGRIADTRAQYERALAIARASGDRRTEAWALTNLGSALEVVGRLSEAGRCLTLAQAMHREVGDRGGEASAAAALGAVLSSQGAYGAACEVLRRSIDLYREFGARRAEAGSWHNLGVALCRTGDLSGSSKAFEEALTIARDTGDRRGEAQALSTLGTSRCGIGRVAEALEDIEAARALWRAIGNRTGEAASSAQLAQALHCLGRLAEARDVAAEAAAVCREVGDRGLEACALDTLGNILLDAGDAAAGEARLRESLEISTDVGNRLHSADTRRSLGVVRLAAGDEAEARAHLTAARDVAGELGAPGVEVLARCWIALLPGGDPQDALSSWSRHDHRLGAFDRREVRWLLWRATGDRSHLAQAKRILDDLVEHAPAADRGSMRTNVGTNRDILAACREQGL